MSQKVLFLTLLLMLSATVSANAQEAEYVCAEGNCVNGTGKLTYPAYGAVLEGEFVDGAFTQGKATLPNGDIYEGRFEDNYLISGIKRLKNGAILEGQFIHDVLVEGRITYQDGSSRMIKLRPLGVPR